MYILAVEIIKASLQTCFYAKKQGFIEIIFIIIYLCSLKELVQGMRIYTRIQAISPIVDFLMVAHL